VATATTEQKPAANWVIAAFLVGAAVSVALGVYGRAHDPTGETVAELFFAGQLQMKAWLATVAVLLAVFQLLSALRLYGKLKVPRRFPAWLPDAHRLAGIGAFLFSLPVAYHCLWSLGFETDSGARVVVHGLAGCAFYGAFSAKVLLVRVKDAPAWALPVAGGLIFTTLVAIWLTSSYWFFTTVDGPKL
jgi:Family of unknown function (DUF6529)